MALRSDVRKKDNSKLGRNVLVDRSKQSRSTDSKEVSILSFRKTEKPKKKSSKKGM